MKKIIIISLVVIILIAVAAAVKYFLVPKESAITSFEECVNAGFPIMESYPRQCRADNGEVFSEYIGNEQEKRRLIQINNPRPNQEVSSPILISGKARGPWFFEASFPVLLYDGNNKLIARAVAQAKGDWMTEDFVDFEAEVIFALPETKKGLLVLKKDNPSGLPEYDDSLEVPVYFSGDLETVNLFYYNPKKDKDEKGVILCSKQGLVSVERKVYSDDLIKNTIGELLMGRLTREEMNSGITTEYPIGGFYFSDYALEDGVLTLTFNDMYKQVTGGTCRMGILWLQIEATALQFPGVKEVRFLPEDLFQP